MDLKQYLQDSGVSQADFAVRLDISQGLVSHWITGRVAIPPERVIAICRVTDGKVTPFELCPRAYPDPDWIPPLDAGAAA